MCCQSQGFPIRGLRTIPHQLICKPALLLCTADMDINNPPYGSHVADRNNSIIDSFVKTPSGRHGSGPSDGGGGGGGSGVEVSLRQRLVSQVHRSSLYFINGCKTRQCQPSTDDTLGARCFVFVLC